MASETTTKFKVDISELKKSMQDAKRQIALANSEFREAASTMDDWSKSSDGITAKLKQLDSTLKSQKSILSDLEKQYELTVAEMGEGSKAADDLKIKINNQRTAINKTEREMAKFEDSLTEVEAAEKKSARTGRSVASVLDEMDDEAKEASDGFTTLKGAIATFAGNAMSSFVGSIKDGLGNLIGLADETREYRTELAKMETAAGQAGASADYIKDKWHDMGAVLGDEGAVAEGLNNLMAAGFTTEAEMDSITKSLEGAAIKWKDTLKFEGLADGLQETLATGSAVGSFGEMLERSGVNLEDFNKGLGKCKTEADKQNYVLEQLSSLGLAEVSDAYRQNNKDLIDANKANSSYTDTLAAFGEKIEPVTTTVKNGFTELLNKVLELVDGADLSAFTAKVEEGFAILTDTVLPAIKDGFGWILDNKDTLLAAIVGIASGFAAFQTVTAIQGVISAFKTWKATTEGVTIAQKLLNTVMSMNPIGIIIALVVALVAAFVVLWKKSDKFRAFWINLWENVKGICSKAFSAIGKFFTETAPKFIDKMISYFKALPGKIWTWLVNTITKINNWKTNMVNKAKETAVAFINSVVTWLSQLPGKAWTWLVNVVSKVTQWGNNLKAKGKEAAQKLLTAIVEKVKEIPGKMLSVGTDIVKGIWNGISNSLSWIKGKITGWVGDVTSFIKSLFGIASPSKLMRDEVGKWIPEGIAVGIDKNAKSVMSSMKNLTATTLSGVRNNLGGSVSGLSSTKAVGGTVNNFYQTINSPRQLSRIDIYRQSKNLLGFAGGGV